MWASSGHRQAFLGSFKQAALKCDPWPLCSTQGAASRPRAHWGLLLRMKEGDCRAGGFISASFNPDLYTSHRFMLSPGSAPTLQTPLGYLSGSFKVFFLSAV